MANMVSPRRHQYIWHWPDWPNSASTTALLGPAVRAVPNKYAFQKTDKRTDKQTDKQTEPCSYGSAQQVRVSEDRQTNRQTDRQTNRQTEGHRHRLISVLNSKSSIVTACCAYKSTANTTRQCSVFIVQNPC